MDKHGLQNVRNGEGVALGPAIVAGETLYKFKVQSKFPSNRNPQTLNRMRHGVLKQITLVCSVLCRAVSWFLGSS